MAMPHFMVTKFLTESDITAKLVLPSEISEHIPLTVGQHYRDLQVMDSTNQEWTFRYYTRPTEKYKKPIFTTNWLKFVEAKQLQVGDKFVFTGHQVRGEAGTLQMQYMIQMTRTNGITFRGEPTYLDVENFL